MDVDKDLALESIEDAWEDRVRAYEAQGLTRSDAQAVVDAEDARATRAFENPPLAPAEHAWVEERVGRKLTTEEAQLALKDAKLAASWEWEANAVAAVRRGRARGVQYDGRSLREGGIDHASHS